MFISLVSFLLGIIAVLKIFNFITHADCKSKVCLVGKTALVTGGNRGNLKKRTKYPIYRVVNSSEQLWATLVLRLWIDARIGYQIALALLQRGCRVIIADKEEDKKLLENIFKETRSRNVVFKYVDFASLKSTRQLAENIIKDEGKLDILVNNAGMGRNKSAVTEDGLDITMQVNYFSAFLLTHLLAGLLKESKGRVIFTSSFLSYFNDFSLDKLKPGGLSIGYMFHYPNSKLCLVIAADLIAKKLKGYGVTSNAYHPGLASTSIYASALQAAKGPFSLAWLATKALGFLAFVTGKSAEQGAQTGIHLACDNEVEGVSGQFFYDLKPTWKPKLIRNKQLCDEVWNITEELVKLKPNEKL
ncbi:hypothetical protein NQ315_003828 [Exocentrus adspersus]|uniref:Uncharacterized protein n=1 Tax=Exocentrus adspersus TaxID=1586481 RepID=A0AAV8VYP8_9CUCU|nr:hypothetical protein NQ315_003828 [Exocentrus adspersus]